jgi:hypothetical protein
MCSPSSHDVSISNIDGVLYRSRAATNAGHLVKASMLLEQIPLDSLNSEAIEKLELEQCRVAFFKGDHKFISSLNIKEGEPSPQLDLLQIYVESNRIWTNLDLGTVPVNLVNSMYWKYISMFTNNEPDEIVVCSLTV